MTQLPRQLFIKKIRTFSRCCQVSECIDDIVIGRTRVNAIVHENLDVLVLEAVHIFDIINLFCKREQNRQHDIGSFGGFIDPCLSTYHVVRIVLTSTKLA